MPSSPPGVTSGEAPQVIIFALENSKSECARCLAVSISKRDLRTRVQLWQADNSRSYCGISASSPVPRAPAALRAELVELIETVILYKLPRLSREEIQATLQVHDIRETRVYQEAKEEGRKEGIEQGIEQGIATERQRNSQEKLRSIRKMAALKMSAETIADLLGLDADLVRKEMAKNPS